MYYNMCDTPKYKSKPDANPITIFRRSTKNKSKTKKNTIPRERNEFRAMKSTIFPSKSANHHVKYDVNVTSRSRSYSNSSSIDSGSVASSLDRSNKYMITSEFNVDMINDCGQHMILKGQKKAPLGGFGKSWRVLKSDTGKKEKFDDRNTKSPNESGESSIESLYELAGFV